jgi:hypothetical protein
MFVTGEYEPSGKLSILKPCAATSVQQTAISIMASKILVVLIYLSTFVFSLQSYENNLKVPRFSLLFSYLFIVGENLAAKKKSSEKSVETSKRRNVESEMIFLRPGQGGKIS